LQAGDLARRAVARRLRRHHRAHPRRVERVRARYAHHRLPRRGRPARGVPGSRAPLPRSPQHAPRRASPPAPRPPPHGAPPARLPRRPPRALATPQLRAHLPTNSAETEARRKAAYETSTPVIVTIKRGQKVIGDGELITQTHLLVIAKMREQTDQLDIIQLQV